MDIGIKSITGVFVEVLRLHEHAVSFSIFVIALQVLRYDRVPTSCAG